MGIGRCAICTAYFLTIFGGALAQDGETTPIWRLQGWNGNHFYTNDCTEATNVQKQDGNDKYLLDQHGPHFFLYKNQVPGTTPMYRFRGPAGERLLSLDPNEGTPPLGALTNEGVIGYAFAPTSPGSNREPLYRSQNKYKIGDRLFTKDREEHDRAIKGVYQVGVVEIAALVPTKANEETCRPQEIALNIPIETTFPKQCYRRDLCDPGIPQNGYCYYSVPCH